MKYVKPIFLFLITLNLPTLCAEQSTPIETLLTDIQETTSESEKDKEVTVEKNELQDWNDHLIMLKDNWDITNNVPDRTWTDTAIKIAVTTVKANKELTEKLKSDFLDAMNQQSTKFTPDTIAVITEFNNAIDKELELLISEPIIEKTEESKIATEELSTPEPQPEIPATTETIATPAETITTPTETATTEPKKTEPSKEKEENLIEEWNNCLTNIQKRQGDIYALTNKAAELAKKLHDTNQMQLTELTQAFERAIFARGGLTPDYKNEILNYFARVLEIIPATTVPSFEMSSAEEEIAEIQRKQREQEEFIKAAKRAEERYNEEMIRQKALRLGAEKRQLTESQLHKLELSRVQAEQRAAATSLKQLQAEAEQLKLELKKATAEQKAASDKSLFTRAKEKLTEFIWGPTQIEKPIKESIAEKNRQLKQLQEQIAQEEAKRAEQICQEIEQTKRAEEIKTLTGHKLTEIEMVRKAELEAEQRECAQIAASQEFQKQQQTWHEFLAKLAHNTHATIGDNSQATVDAINKATPLLTLIPVFAPSKNITKVANGLKISFINALLDQQRDKQYHLNIFDNQRDFDLAIDAFVRKLKTNPGQHI